MKGLIYKIQCKQTGKFYIGSTTQPIKKRLKNHKSKAKESLRQNTPLYHHFNQVGWENADVIILYELEFQSKQELWQVEKDEMIRYIESDLCLNCNRPYITQHEKKQSDIQYGKRRRTEHIDKERERVKTWRENNPEKYRLQCQRAYEKRLSKQETPTTHS